MKLPVIRAFELSYGYLFRNFFAIARVIWLPLLVMSVASYFMTLQLLDWMIPFMEAVEEAEASGAEPNPAALISFFQSMALWALLMAVLSLIAYAIMAVGILRMVVRDEHYSGFAYVGFGSDELRAMLVFVLLFFIFFGVYVGGLLVVGAIAAGLTAALGQTGGGLSTVLLIALLLVALVWLAVRYAVAIPATVAEQRIGIGRSFSLMAGNFWRAIALTLLIWIPFVVLQYAVTFAFVPSYFSLMADMDPEDPTAVFGLLKDMLPMLTAVGGLLSLVSIPLYFISTGMVYRLLTQGDQTETVAAV